MPYSFQVVFEGEERMKEVKKRRKKETRSRTKQTFLQTIFPTFKKFSRSLEVLSPIEQRVKKLSTNYSHVDEPIKV